MWATIERATQPLSTIGIPQEIGVILQGSFLLAAVIAYEVVKRWADAAEAQSGGRANARRADGRDRDRRDRGGDDMTVTVESAAPRTARDGAACRGRR